MIRRLLMIVGLAIGVAATALVAQILVTPPATSPIAQAQPATTSPTARADDLKQLRRWMTLDQSFSVEARSAAETLLAEYERDAGEYTDAEFYMAVRRLVGLAENGHSNVSTGPIYRRFGLLPLRTYWFSDGLYVVRARRDHEALLGARITAIDGTPVKELEEILMQYHGGHRGAFRRYAGLPLMLSPPILHAVGLAANPERLALDIVGADGEPAATTVAMQAAPVSAGYVPPWVLLLPIQLRGEDEGWLTVRDRDAPLPLYFREGAERFRYHRLERDVAYIQLRANIGVDGNRLKDFTKEVKEQLEHSPPRAIILDNRQNGGGDLTRSADFALELPELVQDGGKVYVLTDQATFSAGIYTSFFPKAANAERTVIVGEHVGDFTRFWAEAPDGVQLPDIGTRIGYATQMHDIGIGCDDRTICHLARRGKWNIAVGSLDPDISVPTTFADFAVGFDPVLERALHEIAESP